MVCMVTERIIVQSMRSVNEKESGLKRQPLAADKEKIK